MPIWHRRRCHKRCRHRTTFSVVSKSLGTTNVIENPQSGVQERTGDVTRWRDASMVERWAASAWLLTESNAARLDLRKLHITHSL
jgi:hypothetical protein